MGRAIAVRRTSDESERSATPRRSVTPGSVSLRRGPRTPPPSSGRLAVSDSRRCHAPSPTARPAGLGSSWVRKFHGYDTRGAPADGYTAGSSSSKIIVPSGHDERTPDGTGPPPGAPTCTRRFRHREAWAKDHVRARSTSWPSLANSIAVAKPANPTPTTTILCHIPLPGFESFCRDPSERPGHVPCRPAGCKASCVACGSIARSVWPARLRPGPPPRDYGREARDGRGHRGTARPTPGGGCMKVGVLQFFSWPERVPLSRSTAGHSSASTYGPDRLRRGLAGGAPLQHLLGLPLGARDGMSGRPAEHLRIGTAVTLASMYHPLRIAEEVALLDVLSGGRVNWGAGRGTTRPSSASG